MFRYRLRTLLILLAVLPPVLAMLWLNPRLAIPMLSLGPYCAFMIWQLRSRGPTGGAFS